MSEVIYGLPAADYRARPEINCSGLKLINKSPLHYWASKMQPREETKAMVIGTASHTSTLEPDDLDAVEYTSISTATGSDEEDGNHLSSLIIADQNSYIVAPEGLDKRTKKGKELWAELATTGRKILRFSDYQTVKGVSNAVRSHSTAGLFLKSGHAEVSIFTEIEGIPAKCRLDWLRPGVICDLKTTDDASPSGFARSCANYGYDMQAAWYLDCAEAAGLSIDAFVFIVVEKSAPYAVGLYELDAASIEVGRTKYQRALSLYRHCTNTGEWPGYSPEIISIQLPAWAMRDAA
jgi:hypothetical protein